MKKFFVSSLDTSKTGFQQHATLDMTRAIEDQIHRRKLTYQANLDRNAINDLKKIIEWNSSLRIGFGWSFESLSDLEQVMADCFKEVPSPFNSDLVKLTSDLRGDWIGFIPFNDFDRFFYEELCVEDLVYFNNKLIEYQTNILRFVTSHRFYQIHLMTRDDRYRFSYFKNKRTDRIALSEAFQYYMDAVADSVGVAVHGPVRIPRDFVEEMIGCHYLHHPDLFFELIQFYTLKGQIYA